METQKLVTTPVNINQLKEGHIYFTVAIGKGNYMYMDAPWRFVEVFTEFDNGMPTKKIRVTLVGPQKPMGLDDDGALFAESQGLLVGTEYPSMFGDNHHRTFPYSLELYEFFTDIVDRKDFAQYELIVGKQERHSALQKVQYVLLAATREALCEKFQSKTPWVR